MIKSRGLLLDGPCNCVQARLGGRSEAAREFLLLEVAQMSASREGFVVVRKRCHVVEPPNRRCIKLFCKKQRCSRKLTGKKVFKQVAVVAEIKDAQ